METRLELHERLCDCLGTRQVYFQPPETVKMKYPSIVYSVDNDQTLKADNLKYTKFRRYSVTIIDKDPDSTLPQKIEESFRYFSFDRSFVSDNLNHFVYTIFV